MTQDKKIKTIFNKNNGINQIDSGLLKTYLSMLDAAFDGIVLVDTETRIIEISKQLNAKNAAASGILLKELLDIQSHSDFEKALVALKKGTSHCINLRFIGSKKSYKTNCFRLIDENSKQYLLFTLSDNSRLAELAEKLKHKEEQFRTIINNTSSWENWVNPEGDLIFVNPAVEKFTGYSIEESIWLFQHPEKYIHNEDYRRVVRKFNECLRTETADTDIFRIRKKDDTVIWIFSSWNPVYGDEGIYLGLRSSFLDITQVKETQKLLEENVTKLKKLNVKLKEANKKIEETSRAGEIFITNMSHLVRTPLNAILGMTEILYGKQLNDEAVEMIHVIEVSAENLLTVINDIVDIKKIESKKIGLHPKAISLYKQVESLFNLFKSETVRKNLQFNLNFPEDNKGLIVKTDPVRLNQILINIIDNAVKYTYKGHIEMNLNILEKTGKKVSVEFSITDTGIGIAEKRLKYIFTGFTRLGTHMTKKIEGSGLGMYISKQLVELMHGSIEVKSAEGRGTTFTIRLPFEIASEIDKADRNQFHESLREKQKQLQHVKLLLVEDQEFNQLLIKKITNAWNCQLEIASNGKEAIQLLKNNPYDIVLMDIQLPVMSGIQATKIIREELPEPARSIPIIALTANAIEGDEEKYLAAGMNDYLPKPLRSHALFELIKRNLRLKGTDPQSMKENRKTEKEKKEVPLYSLDKILAIAKGDESYVTEMIMVFIEQCTEIKDTLIKSNASKNVKVIGENAHKLKSSVNIMGLQSMEKEVIETVELSRNDPENKRIFDLSEYLVQRLAVIIPALKTELKRWKP